MLSRYALLSEFTEFAITFFLLMQYFSLEDDKPSMIPATDAGLIVSYCNIEISDNQLHSLCNRCRVAASLRENSLVDELVATSPLGKCKSEPVMGTQVSGETDVPVSGTTPPKTAGSTTRTSAKLDSSSKDTKEAESLMANNSVEVAAAEDSTDDTARIDVEKFVMSLLAICRKQLLTSVLAERRGFLNMARLGLYGTHQGSTGAASAGATSIATREDGITTPREILRSQSAQDRSQPSIGSTTAGGLDLGDLQIGERSMVSTTNAVDGGIHSFEGANTHHLHDQQSQTLRWDKDATDAPTLDESSTAFYSQSTVNKDGPNNRTLGSTYSLPPLRLQQARQKEERKKVLKRAGYDSGYSRPTPRCLIGSGISAEPSKALSADQIMDPNEQMKTMMSVVSTVEALRLELQIAQAGLTQLHNTMDDEIVWVTKNCPEATKSLLAKTSRSSLDNTGSSSMAGMSNRSRNRCRHIAVTNFCSTWQGFVQTTMGWTLQRWRRAVEFDKMEGVIENYSRAKAIEIFNDVYSEAMSRQLLRPWKTWLKKIQTQVLLERTAAVVEIQRIVRAKLGRCRLKRIKLMRLVTRVQCMFRRFKSRRMLAMRKARAAKRRRMWAQRRIRMFFRMFLRIRQAKKVLLQKKQEKAAEMLQKLHRGAIGRQRYRAIKQQQDREMERLRRQKEVEEAMRHRLAAEKLEEEKRQKEEMELILRRRKAAEEAEEAERKAALLREQTPQRKNLISQLFGSTKTTTTSNVPAVNVDTSQSSVTIPTMNSDSGDSPDKKKSTKGFFGFGASTKDSKDNSNSNSATPTPTPSAGPAGPSMKAITAAGVSAADESSLASIDAAAQWSQDAQMRQETPKTSTRLQSSQKQAAALSVDGSFDDAANEYSESAGASSSKPGSASTRAPRGQIASPAPSEWGSVGSMLFGRSPSVRDLKEPAAASTSSRPASKSTRGDGNAGESRATSADAVNDEGSGNIGGQEVAEIGASNKLGLQVHIPSQSQHQTAVSARGASRDSSRAGSASAKQDVGAVDAVFQDEAITNEVPEDVKTGGISERSVSSPASKSARAGSTSARLASMVPSWLKSGKLEGGEQSTMSDRPMTPGSPDNKGSTPSSPSKKMTNLLSSVKLPQAADQLTRTMSGMFKSSKGDSSPIKDVVADSGPGSPQAFDRDKYTGSSALTSDEAVLKIQLCARRRQARKRVNAKREQVKAKQKAFAAVILWSIVSIQRVARGRKGRRRMIAVRLAAKVCIYCDYCRLIVTDLFDWCVIEGNGEEEE
jgi:hypothetical protein